MITISESLPAQKAAGSYYMENAGTIMANRAWLTAQLQALGFAVLDSKANFVFAASRDIYGEVLYQELKSRGVLVRHFTKERIDAFNRITIGSMVQMEILIKNIQEILEA